MSDLQALPAPGLAVFPQYLSGSVQTVVMKGEPFSNDWVVTHGEANVRPFLTVDADHMSTSHRKHLIDAATGREICELRRESFSRHSRYHGVKGGEDGAGAGVTLFETETHFNITGNKTTLKFANNAAGGGQDELDFKNQPFSSHGTVTYRDQPVAIITRKRMSMTSQFDLEVTPGLDPFLVVAMTVALADREASMNSGGVAGGIAAASGGAGA